MKMGSALFWGILLIILGFSFIFKIVFNIDFPFFKVFVAFIFIFIGLRILFGGFGISNFNTGEQDVVFGDRIFENFEDRKEYSVVFSKGTFDFRDFDLEGETKRIKISTVFGGSQIKLPKDLPVRVSLDGAFSGADLPNGSSAVFGSSTWESKTYKADEPHLRLKVDVVFGGINFRLY
jgi:predicted membrane protein